MFNWSLSIKISKLVNKKFNFFAGIFLSKSGEFEIESQKKVIIIKIVSLKEDV